ncbi:MAG: chloride channel protein [Burkholderiaceae bacterium]|nr:chloride channel protein [Pseudomonadota bacterium]MBS0597006.1 chloride channel protein [Pseudomonadota bacterium]MCO5116775.1 chloride channel protein [Burkholderiaceae bacterium]MCP5218532.1 chloride channel protein [Burkholderiaceae bacterium]
MPTPVDRAVRTPVLWLYAVLTGLLAVAVTSGFRALIGAVEWLSTGHTGSLVEAARLLPPWQRALIGTVGGALAGLVLAYGNRWAARDAQGGRYTDYLAAARAGAVDLNDRSTWVRSVSALLSVGSGASIGREGPMIQLSAWLASRLARAVALSPEQRQVLLICGIACGIGSVYHAPIAGVVFVLELALGFLSAPMVAPVLMAAATAGIVNHTLIDPAPLYAMPAVPLESSNLGLALAAGLVCGGMGWLMLDWVDRLRGAFKRIDSLALRLGLGGLLAGSLSAFVPEVWGNGFSTISHLLNGQILWPWVLVILAAKFAATLFNTGSGAVGGMFTPTLFVGATTGFSLAQIAGHWLPPEAVGDPLTLAVIGMSAMLSAVTHAPLMAIVMVLEMTNQFQLTVPVMLACGVAHAISTQFGTQPMYGNPIEARH